MMSRELTDDEVVEIRHFATHTAKTDMEIAKQFKITVQHVQMLRRTRTWRRTTRLHLVAGKMMSITQIAAIAGVGRPTIFMRLQRGIRGEALIAPKHKSTRKERPKSGVEPTRGLSLKQLAERRQREFAEQAQTNRAGQPVEQAKPGTYWVRVNGVDIEMQDDEDED